MSSKIDSLPGPQISTSFVDLRISKPGGIGCLDKSYHYRNQSGFSLKQTVVDVTPKPKLFKVAQEDSSPSYF